MANMMKRRIQIIYLLGIIFIPMYAWAQEQNVGEPGTFTDKAHGFAITGLPGWKFISSPPKTDAPLVTVMKSMPEGISPSIKVSVKSMAKLEDLHPREILREEMAALKSTLPDFKTEDSPKQVSVDGRTAGYTKVCYSVKTAKEAMLPACSEFWLVPKSEFFFLIDAFRPQNTDEAINEEMKRIVRSITLK